MLKYHQFINESKSPEGIIDTEKECLISIRELSDICNLLSDEGGTVAMRIEALEDHKMENFKINYLLVFGKNDVDMDNYNSIVDNIIQRIESYTGETYAVGDGVYRSMTIKCGERESIIITLTDEEREVLNCFLEDMDMDKAGFDDSEQIILNSISSRWDVGRDISLNFKQYLLLRQFLDMDLERIGLFDNNDISLLHNIYMKMDKPNYK